MDWESYTNLFYEGWFEKSKNGLWKFKLLTYFKKTLNHIFSKFEPRFKKISHKVELGDTFDSILNQYSVKKEEITAIKKKLSKKINLNKIRTDQKIELTLDQSKNEIKEFIFQISNTEKIYLTRNINTDKFDHKKLITKLNKNIIYQKQRQVNLLEIY